MQAKDISDIPVLKFLTSDVLKNRMGACIFPGFDNSVQNAMPEWANEKLAAAKMKALMRRGLVDGCLCGCRGDFTLTAKGREYLIEAT